MGVVGRGIEGWRESGLRALGFHEMTRKQRRETVQLPLSLALLVPSVGFLTKDVEFSETFYVTVAQVIPVFLLALAVEQRVFRDDPSAHADVRWMRRAVLIVAVGGEAACLAVVAYGDDTLLLRGAVLITLLFIGVLFTLVASQGPPVDSDLTSTAETSPAAKLGGMQLPVLKGERLTLRPLSDEDVEVLLPAVYEPGIAEWWGDTSDADYQREGFRNEGRAFAIDVDGQVAGWLAFHEETEPDYKSVALDIMLRPGFHGRGLGPDALRLAIRWFVDERGHHRFTIDPTVDNHRAIEAYKHVGFKPVGILRKSERAPDGQWRDGLLMDLLADELAEAGRTARAS